MLIPYLPYLSSLIIPGADQPFGAWQEKGNGSSFKEGSADIAMSSYKNLIVKKDAMPEFESKVKESPMLKNCLSCHVPKGWTSPGIIKDDKYGK